MTERTGAVVLDAHETDDTLACLDALECSADLDVRIVVAHDGPASGERHRELAEGLGGRADLLATGEGIGCAASTNLAVAQVLDAGVDRVWVLGADVCPEPSALGRLNAHLDAVPDCAVVGPRVLSGDDPPRILFEGARVDRRTASVRPDHDDRVVADLPSGPARDTDQVTGAAMLMRAGALRDVGPLPEDLSPHYEQIAWCLAAADRGWRIMVLPGARVLRRDRSGSSVPSAHYVYAMTRNRLLLAERVLGADPERALESLERDLLTPWRVQVQTHAPDWLETFEEVVRRGLQDARSGVTGPVAEIDGAPAGAP